MSNVYGYDIDEIDQLAGELKTVLEDADADSRFALMALCRCITLVSDPADLDLACVVIDRFAERGDE